MDHSKLIEEMPRVEQMPTQDRLALARKRRSNQLKSWSHKEREHEKAKRSAAPKRGRRGIRFQDSVVLLEAAARNDVDEARRLLMRGVDADSCNEDGLTALHQCCIDDNERMLSLLLEYGADANARDSERWTPLHAAATCGHVRLVSILIARGADLLAVNADGNMPYDICEDEAALDLIEGEMAKRGVTQQLIDETRAATERAMLDDVRAAFEAGSSLDGYDAQGATPLHIASANGYVSVVEFLLENGARIDAKDKDDWQPTHAAACWGHLDVLELLARAGADLNARNRHDETPSDICEDPDIKERVVELLNEQETKRQQEAAKRKIRRSQSNTRTQSVRRTSLRDRGLTARRDAVEEARFRLRAGGEARGELGGEAGTGGGVGDPDSAEAPARSVPAPNASVPFIDAPNSPKPASIPAPALSASLEPRSDRKPPEGRDDDDDAAAAAPSGDDKTYSTDVNGKVTVHVVVTINGNGTLADLKKQRMQIRSGATEGSNSPVNSPVGSVSGADSGSAEVSRFTGNTTEENVDFAKPRRCCAVQ